MNEGIQGVFRTFPQPKKSAEVTRQSSPRVPASVSSSELSAHQKALARGSYELADEPGDALDAALADLQRWWRGWEGGVGGGGAGDGGGGGGAQRQVPAVQDPS